MNNTTYKNYSISVVRSAGGACIITIADGIHWKATLDFASNKYVDANKVAKDWIDSVIVSQ